MAKSALLIALASIVVVLSVGAVAAPPHLEKALEAQRQLVADRPAEASPHNDLGNLLLLAGRSGEAESAYERAIALDPGHLSARFNLALLLQQSARSEEAAVQLDAILERQPDHAWALYQRGVILAADGDRKDALEHFARAFAVDPTLSFPRKNPHIIDNELATEALLMSSRYGQEPGARAPRQYDEAERIAELMLRLDEAERAAADAEAAQEAGDGEGEGEAGGAVPGQPRASFEEDGGGSERVLTNENLDESELGQARRGRPGTRSGRTSVSVGVPQGERRAPVPRYRPRSGNTTNPTIVVPPPAPRTRQELEEQRRNSGRERYRPSRRSTASLSLDLLPADSRPAAAG